jgi:ABC-type Fe3+/spermidine/putrescine transport system ATPase subunit
MPTLQLNSICLHIENFNVLDEVSFEVDEEEITVITGPNGCGKSSLLQCISGNIRHESGDILFNNTNVNRLSPMRRKAFLVGDWEIAPRTKVVDAITAIARQWGVPSKERAQCVDQAMIAMKLLPLSERRVRSLSTSERRRIYPACALAVQPEWILADNPYAYMHDSLRDELMQNMIQFCREKEIGLILATDNLQEAFFCADKLILMDRGKLLQEDHPRKLQQCPNSIAVAEFVNNANIFEAEMIQHAAGMAYVKSDLGEFSGILTCPADSYKEGKKVHLCIRPESVNILQMPADENCFEGQIKKATNKGIYAAYAIETKNELILNVIESNPRFLDSAGEQLHFWVAPDDIAIVP